MTTIAYRDGVLAADSQVTSCNNCPAGSIRKIGRLPDGSLWAFSGALMMLEACLAWGDAQEGNPPKLEDGVFIVIRPGGAVRQWWGEGWIQTEADIHAWGSGERCARAAMMAGVEPGRAIEIASALDTDTGGEVTVLRLKQDVPAVRAA